MKQVDTRARWQNVKLKKCQVDKMLDKLASWQNVR
jgi:hypothetical protein